MDLLNLFTREEPIAGLEINDSFIRLMLLEKKKVKEKGSAKVKYEVVIKLANELAIPDGVIKNGRIVDSAAYIKTVTELLKKVKNSIRYAVVTVFSDKIYSKTYTFPRTVKDEKIRESMKTIIELQLPFAPKDNFIDWDQREDEESKVVFLSSLNKEIANEHINALIRAGIKPIAIEPHIMSVIRSSLSEAIPTLFAISYKHGVSISIVENKNVVFNRFLPFEFISKEKIGEEIRKIKDFYEAENKKNVEEIMFLGESYDLPLISKMPFKIIEPFNKNPEIMKNEQAWLAVAGAALRGIMPRSEDASVSLMPVGTEEAYENQKALTFVDFICTAAIGISIFFVAAFIGSWMMMISMGKRFNDHISALNNSNTPGVEFSELESRAVRFNDLIGKTAALLKDMPTWSSFLEELRSRVTSGILINGLSLPQANETMLISGVALNRNQLNNFKKSLEDSSWLSEVTLPLTNLAQKENIPFSISFRLKDPASLYLKGK